MPPTPGRPASPYGGYSDWRLPTTLQPDASCGSSFDAGAPYGVQSYGYNCTGSELGHLFYTGIGRHGRFIDTGQWRPRQPCFRTSSPYVYWSWYGPRARSAIHAWGFYTYRWPPVTSITRSVSSMPGRFARRCRRRPGARGVMLVGLGLAGFGGTAAASGPWGLRELRPFSGVQGGSPGYYKCRNFLHLFGIMARYEHLPIYKAAPMWRWVSRSWWPGFPLSQIHAGHGIEKWQPPGGRAGGPRQRSARERLPELLALRQCLDSLLLTMRLAMEVRTFKGFKAYAYMARQVASVCPAERGLDQVRKSGEMLWQACVGARNRRPCEYGEACQRNIIVRPSRLAAQQGRQAWLSGRDTRQGFPTGGPATAIFGRRGEVDGLIAVQRVLLVRYGLRARSGHQRLELQYQQWQPEHQ